MVYFYVHRYHSYSFLQLTFSPLFPNLSDWGKNLPVLNPLESNGYFSSTIYKIKKFYILTPKRVCVFVRISEQAGIISKHDINWSVFIFQTEGVYCAVRDQWRGKIFPPV